MSIGVRRAQQLFTAAAQRCAEGANELLCTPDLTRAKPSSWRPRKALRWPAPRRQLGTGVDTLVVPVKTIV